LALSRGAMSSSERKIVQNEVTLRIRCIRLIRDSESLTVQETADRLKLAPELIKSQFLKLRQLELIELAGCRETRAGIQAVYKLNELNPSLDFVLAQGPAEIKSPHEIAERERVKRP
jgi:predicted transcriptional regulator